MLSLSTKEILELRANFMERARGFFARRNIMEVETQALTRHPALDPNIDPFSVSYFPPGEEENATNILYLHTSPEHGMKRLLAEGAGAIYQIARVFRNGEWGRLHNPEFTMLEWYRPGFSLWELMDEVSLFTETMLHSGEPSRTTYKELFEETLSINPLSVSAGELVEKCNELKLAAPEPFKEERDALLQYLLAEKIEPHLGFEKPAFIYDFPPSQAALAKITPEPERVAKRFELYINGVELANGYHELTDPAEQERRSEAENKRRELQGKSRLPIDLDLIDALKKGLPDCSGVACGFDRLLMIASKAESVHDILPLSYRP